MDKEQDGGSGNGIIKTFRVGTYQKYLEYKRQLALINHPYVERHKGSIITIECNNYRWTFKKGGEDEKENKGNIKKLGGQGYHICKLVRQDVEDYLAKAGDSFDHKTLNSLKAYEELYNHKSLLANVGKDMWSVDIDDCYWDTLYKLGYISFRLYIMALKKRQWKQGRNASIGALAANTKVYDFIGDRQVDFHDEFADESMSAVRKHVIFNVWETFRNIIIENGDSVLMFFKDCAYVSNMDTVRKILDFLTKLGYMYKIRAHHLVDFNPATRMTEWYCYNNIGEKKYYRFIEDQEITHIGLLK